jgi:hypothetical protein
MGRNTNRNLRKRRGKQKIAARLRRAAKQQKKVQRDRK